MPALLMRIVGGPSYVVLVFEACIGLGSTYVFYDFDYGSLYLLRIAHVALVVEDALLLGLLVVYLLRVKDCYVGIPHAVRLGEESTQTAHASSNHNDLLAQINLPGRTVRKPVAEDVEYANCAHEHGPSDRNAHLKGIPWSVLRAQTEH